MKSVNLRDRWGRELDFLLSIIGFAVDLSNVWRFPYLAYINGGGAFLIPYFLMLLLGALPLLYMELLLGQVQQEGCISVWKLCPFFKGVGVTQMTINAIVSCYYNVIIGWCLYYTFSTITSNLPWMRCSPSFSTLFCLNSTQMHERNMLKANYTRLNITWPPPGVPARAQLPSQEFFERAVLDVQDSYGLSGLGNPKWQLAVCSFLIYTILFFCIWKGIKSSGKVVYITAIMPYVLLIIILVQGSVLPGSLQGIKYFIVPQFDKLFSSQVWLDAAVQIFYSTGAGFGVHITLASYNSQKTNCMRNCLITAAANSFTSLLAGFTVFAYLGYMSSLTGQDINDVANEGPGLVFQVYPIAVGSLPAAPIWSLLFFVLLIMLGMDSSMGAMESFVTGLRDEFRGFFIRHRHFSRELTTFIVLFTSFLFSLVNVTRGGILVLQLLDRCVGIPLIVAALGQAIAVSWFYGLPKFCADVQSACGYVPGILWRVCWKIISPTFIITVIVFSLINQPPLAYRFGSYHPELQNRLNLTKELVYNFPDWSGYFIWGMSGLQLIMIPLFMIIAVIKYRSFYYAVTPTWEHKDLDCGIEPLRRKPHNWFSFGPLTAKRMSSYELSVAASTAHDNPALEVY